MFEALQLGRKAYYTTPLSALTDQKFPGAASRCHAFGGYPARFDRPADRHSQNQSRSSHPVVVAEILLNRLLHREAFDFSDVWAVVMGRIPQFE
jgi:hypothetical protein